MSSHGDFAALERGCRPLFSHRSVEFFCRLKHACGRARPPRLLCVRSSNLVSWHSRGCQGETILAVLMTVPLIPSHTTHHIGANPVHARAAEYPSSLVQFAGLRTSGSRPWPQSLSQDGEPMIRSISCEDIPVVTAWKFLSNRVVPNDAQGDSDYRKSDDQNR